MPFRSAELNFQELYFFKISAVIFQTWDFVLIFIFSPPEDAASAFSDSYYVLDGWLLAFYTSSATTAISQSGLSFL